MHTYDYAHQQGRKPKVKWYTVAKKCGDGSANFYYGNICTPEPDVDTLTSSRGIEKAPRWKTRKAARAARDRLIEQYPNEHNNVQGDRFVVIEVLIDE